VLLATFSLWSKQLHAITVIWDSNTGSAGIQDGAGSWTSAGTSWINPITGANLAITSGDIGVFGVGGVGGLISISDNPTVLGLIFGQTNTTGYSLGGSAPGTILTLGGSGIVVQQGAQAVSVGDANLSTVLGASQSWVNRSTSTLTSSAISLGANTLTLGANAGLTGTGSYVLNGALTGTGGLTLAGQSIVSLNAVSSITGTITLAGGSSLNLAGATAALLPASSAGLTLNGGSLNITNAVGEQAVDRIGANIGTITSNGGAITWTNPSGDNTANWAETLGTLSAQKGHTTVLTTNAVNAARTQTLTLGGITRAGTATVAFGGAALGTAATNNIVVTGLGTTAASQIIGPWATYGSSATAQTDWASYNRNAGTANTRGMQAAGIAASAETAWTNAANSYTMNAAVTLTATRTIASVRNSGAALTLGLGGSSFNLATYGILNGGTGALTISTTGTGGITTPTGGDNTLYVIGGNSTISVSAPIIDNGNAVNVVKSGNSTVTFSGANSYTGVTTINQGTLTIATIGNGGASSTLGASLSAAPNLILAGGTLSYSAAASTAGSTDRLFTLTEAGGTINNSGSNNNALTFGNTTGSLVMSGTGSRTLNLTAGGTGTFVFSPGIVDPTGGGVTSLVTSAGSTGNIVLGNANTFT
jgi:fibronectin-binding autotransporter adhesin